MKRILSLILAVMMLAAMMPAAFASEQKTLVVLPEADQKVIKSMANIPGVATTPVNAINVYNILKYGKLVMAKDAVAKIEEVYAE